MGFPGILTRVSTRCAQAGDMAEAKQRVMVFIPIRVLFPVHPKAREQ